MTRRMSNDNKDIIQFLTEENAKDTKEARLMASKALSLTKEHGVKLDTVIEKQSEIKNDIDNHSKDIQTLKTTTETQEVLLSNLIDKQNAFNTSLGEIQKTMIQIKWAAFGALGMFVLESFGLQEFIKAIFK